MGTDGYTQLFSFLQSITNIPATEQEKIAQIFQPSSLKKGAFFLRAGEVPHTLGFLVSGIIRLYYIDSYGVEFIKSFCVENELIAAYSALLLNEPSRLFIQALEDCTLLVTPYYAYQALSSKHLCWQVVNRRVAEVLFIKKEKRESSLLRDDAKTRYINFLTEYPGLELRLKQHQIASYLGITPVSLSRIRAQL